VVEALDGDGLMKVLASVLILFLTVPAQGQQPVSESVPPKFEEQIARISRAVVFEIVGSSEILVPALDSSLAARITHRILNETEIPPAIADGETEEERASRRRELTSRILQNLGKGVAIVVILTLIAWLIPAVDLVVRGESAREEKRLASLVKMDPEILAVVVPTATHDEATRIGRSLVESRLAASANVSGPIQTLSSDPTHDRQEVALMLLTRRRRLSKLRRAVRDLHSSPDPAVYPFAIRQGYKPLMQQIRKATRKSLFT
jgi:uncharacterized protein involved in tolerance to divalent cations